MRSEATRLANERTAKEEKAGREILDKIRADLAIRNAKLTDLPVSTALQTKNKDLCITTAKGMLKDPYSAKIEIARSGTRNVEMISGQYEPRVEYLLTINAKNSFGAYGGARAWRCHFSPDETRFYSVYQVPD